MTLGLAPGHLDEAARQLRSVGSRLLGAAERHAMVSRDVSYTADRLASSWSGPLFERWRSNAHALVDDLREVPGILDEARHHAMRLATEAEQMAQELRFVHSRLAALREERRICERSSFGCPDDAKPGMAARISEIDRDISVLQGRLGVIERNWQSSANRSQRVWDQLTALLERAARTDEPSPWPMMSSGERAQRIAVATALGQARREAARLAREASALLDSPDPGLDDWQALTERLLDFDGDAAFAAAWVVELGPERLAFLPEHIEQAWRANGYDADPALDWATLAPISETFARATAYWATNDGLPPLFIEDLFATTGLEAGTGGSDRVANFGQVALLFAGEGFSEEALVELAAVAERLLPGVARNRLRLDDAGSPWGAWGEPSATMLTAISHSAVAAASQPRLAAQIMVSMDLPYPVHAAMELEVARQASMSRTYEREHLFELLDLGVPFEQVSTYAVTLLATGRAVSAAAATHHTISDYQRRATQASHQLRTGASPQIKSQAGRTLQGTPSWVAPSRTSPLYLRAGRIIPVAGIALTAEYHISQGRGIAETSLRTAGSAVGGAAGMQAGAALATPFMGGGPIIYGGAVVIGGLLGALLGDRAALVTYEIAIAPHRDAILWINANDMGQLAAGPPAPIGSTSTSRSTSDD